MAIKNTIRQRPPAIPKPKDLPPGSQEWARWVSERMRELQNKSGIVQKNVLVLGKDKNAVFNLTQRQGNSIRDAQGRIAEAEGELALAQERLDQAREDLDELNDVTLPGLEQELQDNGFEIEQLQGRLNDVDGELVTLQNDLSGLDAELLANSQAIEGLDGRMDGVDTELQGLETSLSTLDTQLQTGISNLQGQIDDIILDGAGGVSIVYSVNNPSGTDWKEGSTWFKWNSPSSRRIIGQWNFNGTAWESVTLADQVIANLDAGKITTGFIDAGRIDARTISTDKLIIGSDGNLIPNGAAEMGGLFGWAPSILNYYTTGTPAGETGAFGCPRGQGTVQGTTDSWWDVIPGQQYVFSVWLRADRANSHIYIEARNQDSSHAGTSAPIAGENDPSAYNRAYLVANLPLSTTWTRYSSIWTAGPNSRRVRIASLYFNHSHGTERDAVQFIAGMRLQRRTGATLIEDGAITTDKVAANAITGGKILAGSITASDAVFATGAIKNADIGDLNAGKINAGTLAAARIASGSITGDKIQANSITAAHGVFATGAIQNADIGNLNASKINAGTLAAARIAGGSITGEKLAANTITTRELTSANITGLNIVGSTITGTTIVGADITGTNTLTGGRLDVDGGEIRVFNSTSSGSAVETILSSSTPFISNTVDGRTNLLIGDGYIQMGQISQRMFNIQSGTLGTPNSWGYRFVLSEGGFGSYPLQLVRENGTNGASKAVFNTGLEILGRDAVVEAAPPLSPSEVTPLATRSYAMLRRTSNLSLGSSSQIINFDTWSNVTSINMTRASGGCRVSLPGMYAIDVVMTISAASGSIAGCVLVNGVERAPSQISNDLGTIRRLHYTIHTALSANDLVQLEKRNAGTGTLSTGSFLSLTRVSP